MTTATERHPDWINPQLDLNGVEGNAFSIIAYVDSALRQAGNSRAVRDQYRDDAIAGDHNHLVRVSMLYGGMLG
jgi:hypothetical protein